MDVGLIILCPDRNVGGLKNTLGSVKHNTYDREAVCVVGGDAEASDMAACRTQCPTHKAGGTLTSLINTGMAKTKHDWGFLVFAGSRVPAYIERKLAMWAREETDVVFPVVDRRFDFVTGSFNGVLVNTAFFKKVGDLPDVTVSKPGVNDFELAKLLWALEAMAAGCTFKAIVGMRII